MKQFFDPHLLLLTNDPMADQIKKFTNLENKNADTYKSYSLGKELIGKIQSSKGTLEEEEKFKKLALYEYSIGAYHEAADKLFFLAASRFPGIKRDALWGKLSCEILLGNWKSAEKAFKDLEIEIEKGVDLEAGLRCRVYLAHYVLFFSGQFQLELFFKPAYMNAIQVAAPWLLKYVVVAVLLYGKKYIKDLTRILSCESQIQEPIVSFFESIYCKSLDLKLACSKLKEIQDLQEDYFINKKNFTRNCQKVIFEVLVKTRSSVGFDKVGSMLNLDSKDVYGWIMEYQKEHSSILVDEKSKQVSMIRRKKQTIKDVLEHLNQLGNTGMSQRGSVEFDEYLVGPKYAM